MPFQQLVNAVKSMNYAEVQRLLETSDKSLYTQTDSTQKTILHIALQYSTGQISAEILKHIKRFACQKILHHTDLYGLTPLHIAVACSDYDGYTAVINALGEEATKACLKPNRGAGSLFS